MSILHEIVKANAEELAAAERALPATELLRKIAALPPAPRFAAALQAKRACAQPAVIAELKAASPSKGVIREPLDCATLAAELEAAGAAALSVLTEPHFFHGSLENLRRARATCTLPLLRKDFIVNEYQLMEARAAGASAALLIAALLDDDARLRDLVDAAHGLGLEVLLEAHTDGELERALATQADLVGVNARDLHTFQTSLEAVEALVRRIPADRTPIAESALRTHEDIVRLQAAGATGFLMGETLMRAPCPAERLRDLLHHADRLHGGQTEEATA